MWHFLKGLNFNFEIRKSLGLVLLFFFYVGFAWAGMWITSKPPSSLAVIWLPSGIGLVAAIIFKRSGLILVLLASGLTNGSYGYFSANEHKLEALYSGLLSGVVDMAQTWIAWRIFRVSHRIFPTSKELVNFFFRVCVLPSLLTVWILPLIWQRIGGIPISNGWMGYFTKTIQVVSADALGLFLITPFFLTLRHFALLKGVRIFLESGILLGIPLILAIYIHIPLISLIAPVTLFLVVKYRLVGSSVSLVISTIYLLLFIRFSDISFSRVDWFSYFNLTFLILCIGFVPHYIAINLEQLRQAKKNLEVRVMQRTRELMLANEQLEMTANTDLLTGLLTRRAFLYRFKYESGRSNRTGKSFALAILDLDFFKQINDTYGHQVGDEVLLAFSQIIVSHLRVTDIACRWGGEEFLILFPDTTQKEAEIPLTRIRKFTESSEDLSALVDIRLTVSIGVSDSIESDTDFIIAHADKALYSAKTSGRNKICFYEKISTY